MIGTCNWDIRSIILHEEVVAAIYDTQIARSYAAQYETDIDNCLEITLERLQAFSSWEKFRNQIYRLFSRLL
jgi:cardiolipin synthase